jgi:PhnB protein
MQGADIYLNFNGNSLEAFTYYKSIFGGEFMLFQRYKDMPGGDKMSPKNQEKIIHVSLRLTPHTVLMATDGLGERGEISFGNNYHICLQADNEKEADTLFQSLSKDGKIEMPMNKTFWGAYFGMCQDKFGVMWMINFTLNPNS